MAPVEARCPEPEPEGDESNDTKRGDERVRCCCCAHRVGLQMGCSVRREQQEGFHPSYLAEEVVLLVVVAGRERVVWPA